MKLGSGGTASAFFVLMGLAGGPPRDTCTSLGRRCCAGVRIPARLVLPIWRGLCRLCWLDSNEAHHAAVFMLKQVAVVRKGAYDTGGAEIHAQLDARVFGGLAVPKGDVNGVAEKGFVRRRVETFDQQEMDLVDVEGVQFERAILDDPVLDVALVDD